MNRFHTLIVALSCIAILFVRVMGVHGHVAQEHHEHPVFAGYEQIDSHHEHAVASFVSSHDVDHELAHISHGAIELDVDPPLVRSQQLCDTGGV